MKHFLSKKKILGKRKAEKPIKKGKMIKEARDKQGRFLKNAVPWNKGIPMPEKARKKESLTKNYYSDWE